MKKWEYNVVDYHTPLEDSQLNKLGEQGWELVSYIPYQLDHGIGECHYIFKRPRED